MKNVDKKAGNRWELNSSKIVPQIFPLNHSRSRGCLSIANTTSLLSQQCTATNMNCICFAHCTYEDTSELIELYSSEMASTAMPQIIRIHAYIRVSILLIWLSAKYN